MPIWQVSHTDGLYQVADADGVLYPLTMNDVPISEFNEGWSPRGLQTGVPPLHVLELEHVSGMTTIWLHDETLNYRANAVIGLPEPERTLFFDTMDPVVRALYDECVRAPHASIPAVSHRFTGLLSNSVALLLDASIERTMTPPDRLQLPALADLEAGYGDGPVTLTAGWFEAALAAPPERAQERFDLPGLHCQRHLDPATTQVFYLLRGIEDGERHLYVPGVNLLVSATLAGHDVLRLLILYYAANTDRVVSLPEALDLAHDVLPSLATLPQVPAPAPTHALGDAPQHAMAEDAPRTSFEAPLSETPQPLTHPDEPPREPAYAESRPGPASAQAPAPAPARPAPEPANWWQRLLGLGNG